MIRKRIKWPKTQHPAQKPKKDSKVAKIAKTRIIFILIDQCPIIAITRAEVENKTPIACANLFGGPITDLRGFPKAGIIPFVTISPNGLKVGPVKTLAQKPYVKKPKSQMFSVVTISMERPNTSKATILAAYSFTTSGKEKIPDKVSFFTILIPC